ncbi:DMC1-like protein [Tribonema minus]|uniref:DMC1-like protein n=1 Tax=Tribonema minus TaxID=303371 RepID=A0A835YPZ9_9STRA|nr:DMC1-like protein [Tribonema minus]
MSATKQKGQAAVVVAQAPDAAYEVVVRFVEIEQLAKHAINAADIQKLKEQGIATVGMLFQCPLKTLHDIRGFSETKVAKILETARKVDPRAGIIFRSGIEARDERRNVIKITTGSAGLDGILGGGVETGSITEFYGEFRTGKTQMMHTLAVTAQLDIQSGGGAGRVVFIDTENNFRPERIENIAERFGIDGNEVLENIFHCQPQSHEQQMDFVHAVGPLATENGPIRLVIVDSIITLFRTDFSGRGELAERQQKLNKHMTSLKNIAREFNAAVVIINQVMADPGAISMFATVKPVGGHVVAHASTTRVMLKKGRGEERIAKICDSPLMPEAEATFRISDGGITDPE